MNHKFFIHQQHSDNCMYQWKQSCRCWCKWTANMANIGTMNCAAKVVGNRITPSIWPCAEENCCNINRQFLLKSWEIVANADELEFLRWDLIDEYNLSWRNNWLKILFAALFLVSEKKCTPMKHQKPTMSNVRIFYIFGLNFLYCMFWGYLRQKKLVVLLFCQMLLRCSRLTEQLHVRIPIWWYHASFQLH